MFVCLGAKPPARCLRVCKSAYSPCVLSSSLRSCFLFILFFFSSFPFLDFDLDVVCFILFFLWLACCLFDVGFVATRLAYDKYLMRTYADLTFFLV